MLEGIISYLNAQITSSGYVEKVYGLAQLVDRGEKTFPAVYCDGDWSDTTDFDKWQGLSYWRLTAATETIEAENPTGTNTDLQYNYPLRLVLGVKRDHLTKDDSRYNPDKLGWAVQKLFKNKDVPLKRSIGAKRCSIQFASIDNDIKRIIEAELIGVDRKIPDDYILIAADVVIQVVASQGCIDTFCDSVAAPTLLTSTSASSGVTLSWTDNSSNETNFLIFRSNTIDGLYSQIGSVAAGVTTYEDTTGTVDVSYYYKVKATDGTSNSVFSNAACGVKYSASCDDATATLNGDTLAVIASGDSEAITVEQDSVDITATCSTDGANKVIVPAATILNTANNIVTGQTVSYAANDDGDLEAGRLVNYTTLDHNNVFGSTNRFTDTLGTQIYANGVVVDHSTWNQLTDEIDAYYSDDTTRDFTTHLTFAASLTIGSYSDWRFANIVECLSLIDYSKGTNTTTDPFLAATAFATAGWASIGGNCHSSTTYSSDTTRTMGLSNSGIPLTNQTKTANRDGIYVTTLTWNGSALV